MNIFHKSDNDRFISVHVNTLTEGVQQEVSFVFVTGGLLADMTIRHKYCPTLSVNHNPAVCLLADCESAGVVLSERAFLINYIHLLKLITLASCPKVN